MAASNRFRITGGRLRGRKLHAPSTPSVRPMQGAVREALFNILGERIQDASLLDLFSGTGSIGIEAMSRGAASCVFVDRYGPALRTLSRNLRALGLEKTCPVLKLNLLKVCAFPPTGREPYQGIFLDPPFAFHDPPMPRDLSTLLAGLEDQGFLAKHTFLTLQIRRIQTQKVDFGPFHLLRRKDYGSISLLIYDK